MAADPARLHEPPSSRPAARTQRLEAVRRHLVELHADPLTVDRLDDVYRTMGHLAWAIESCSADLGGMQTTATDRDLDAAQQVYRDVYAWLVAHTTDTTFLAAVESTLRTRAAALLGGPLEETPLVWEYHAGGPSTTSTRCLQVLLASAQLGTAHDVAPARHLFVEPGELRYQLLVRTPVWLHTFACTEARPAAQFPAAPLDALTVDYLRGIWRPSTIPGAFERSVYSASRLASHHARRRAADI